MRRAILVGLLMGLVSSVATANDDAYWTLVRRVSAILRVYRCEINPDYCGPFDAQSPEAQRIVEKLSPEERQNLLARTTDMLSKEKQAKEELNSILPTLLALSK